MGFWGFGVATEAKDEIRKKREEDAVVRGPGVDRCRRLHVRRAEEASVEMQRDPFSEEVLSDDAAREQNDGAVYPHGNDFSQRDPSLGSAFCEVGRWTTARQKCDHADEQDDHKETDRVVKHLGYRGYAIKFRAVERHAVAA